MRISLLAIFVAVSAFGQVFPMGNRSSAVACGTLSAATGNIAGSEVQVVQCVIPPNTLQVGSSFAVMAYGQANNSVITAQTYSFRVRINTTSLSAGQVDILSPANNQTTQCLAAPIQILALVTIRSIGSSGTGTGNISAVTNNGTGATAAFSGGANSNISAITATASIDTTVTNIIEFTAATSSASVVLTFQEAAIIPMQ